MNYYIRKEELYLAEKQADIAEWTPKLEGAKVFYFCVEAFKLAEKHGATLQEVKNVVHVPYTLRIAPNKDGRAVLAFRRPIRVG